MVIRSRKRRERGSLMTEMLVAIGLLAGTLLPLAYSIASERKTTSAYYQRALAMEIVDGEMETLVAGNPHGLALGTRDYAVHAIAATNLPPGSFLLTVTTNGLRLEWKPAVKNHGGPVVREVSFR